jgi:large subunit ribosomal protein L32e
MAETKNKTKPAKKAVAKKETKKDTAKVEKVEAKKDTKAKDKKEETKKVVKKKYIPKVKKDNRTKSAEAKKVQERLKELKKKLPTFRGRFGKKNIRKKSKAKWDKWRKPRSIDLDRGLQHGYRPKIGYRTEKEIRGMHPSGYEEVRIENLNSLKTVDPKTQAIRISATVGKRKRNEIVTEANKKGIWVIN